jgi:hypothetical protein
VRGRLTEAERSLRTTLEIVDAPDVRVWHSAFTTLVRAERPAGIPDAASPGAIWFLGHALFTSGADLNLGARLVDHALATATDPWEIAAARGTRAKQALVRGDLTTARADAEQAHEVFQELGDA